MRRYTVVLTPDPETGGYTVTVPALPGCVTAGDTVDEAIANAQDLVPLWVRRAGEELRTDVSPVYAGHSRISLPDRESSPAGGGRTSFVPAVWCNEEYLHATELRGQPGSKGQAARHGYVPQQVRAEYHPHPTVSGCCRPPQDIPGAVQSLMRWVYRPCGDGSVPARQS